MTKVLIAIPTFENISPNTFKSVYDLQLPDNVGCGFEFIRGYDCAKARNSIAKIARGFDYVFMVDSDIILPSDALTKLLNVDKNIVFGYYPSKNDPSKSEVFKTNEDSGVYESGYLKKCRWTIDELQNHETEILQIKGSGFGCVLIKTTVFESMIYPYFKYVVYENDTNLSEDLYFCSVARKLGYELFVHTKVRCKHVGRIIY